MYCGNCGKPLPDGVAFCSECGAPVSQPTSSPANRSVVAPPTQQTPNAAMAQVPPGPHKSRLLLLVVVLCGIALAVVLGLFLGRRRVASVVPRKHEFQLTYSIPSNMRTLSRIPLRVSGTTSSGSAFEDHPFHDADGGGVILLPEGEYEIEVEAPVILEDGGIVVYDDVLEIYIDQDSGWGEEGVQVVEDVSEGDVPEQKAVLTIALREPTPEDGDYGELQEEAIDAARRDPLTQPEDLEKLIAPSMPISISKARPGLRLLPSKLTCSLSKTVLTHMASTRFWPRKPLASLPLQEGSLWWTSLILMVTVRMSSCSSIATPQRVMKGRSLGRASNSGVSVMGKPSVFIRVLRGLRMTLVQTWY